jgi:diguanylate cyclase (GGDEF)-like protein/PAS domain S-box-containing protein/putative nucleotidyltransferase with HDIG domain
MIRFIFWPESSNDFLAFSFDSYFIVLNGFINVLLLSGLLSVVYGFVNQELNENERIKSSLLANLPGFAFRCKNDDNWTMIYVSDSFKDLTGYDKEQIINNKEISYEQLIRSSFREEVRLGWEQTFELNTKYSAEYQLTIADGSHIWVWEQSTPTIDKDTNEVIIEGFIADIAARKEIEENLEYLSFHDVLTGLYNRRYIEDKLVEFDHQNTYPISVIMADINGLKFINDSFGHNYGDEVIVETGRIFSEVIGEDNYISRLSGDEFLAILPNIDFNETKMLVDRIHEQINLIRKDRFNLSVAIGYASKVSPTQSLNNIRIIAEDNMYQQKVYEKPSNRRKTVDAVLGTLFEKDTLSEQHSRNVANYSKKLAQAAGLNQSMINQTETAALLHDVGKIIIDTAILTSPNRLSLEEYNEIKKHPEIGYRILNNVPELQKIAEIILCHHERIDGKGYPRYLKGDKIPYISKIISICDAYDAMVNKRYYRSPIGKNEAFAELKRNAGTQFDSELVDIFIEVFQ